MISRKTRSWRNRYESAFGTLRVGRLLEDMDALAGSVAYLHVDDGDPDTAPPILVTASMERLEVRDDTLALDEDYNLVGSLVWAGRSSPRSSRSCDTRTPMMRGPVRRLHVRGP